MPSMALQYWRSDRAILLDEMENAHRSVGGTGRGRRFATLQINQAYAVLLSSHFQGFCRDLHTECVGHIVRHIGSPTLNEAIRSNFVLHRKLDSGNPNSGNIGADFNRFDIDFWDKIANHDPNTLRRRNLLQELNEWRNAIAHQDFDPIKLGGTVLLIKRVRAWRSACEGMAVSFDDVMRDQLKMKTGKDPW